MLTVAVTEPSVSSVESSLVEIVNVTLPLVGIVTVREPVLAPKSPLWLTVTLTGRSADGDGLAVTVNSTLPPSVTLAPALMLTTGVGGTSLSDTATVPADCEFETV